jgi:exonuclease III
MKILSFNVNGVRAALKKGLLAWRPSKSPRIVTAEQLSDAQHSDHCPVLLELTD